MSYLGQHPLTNKKAAPALTTTKIIETVATLFADQKQESSDVSLTTKRVVQKIMENLGLRSESLGPVIANITKTVTAALIDCANGKAIEPEKAV